MRNKMKFIAIVMLVAAGKTYAQTDTAAKSLEEVVVTASRTEQKEKAIPYTVNTIKRNELNRFQPRTTPEALMGVTGVFVQKTNHGGGSAFLRGLTGNQTLILVDGIRLNNSTFRYGPNQYLNTIDAYSIQQIEVVKGTGSVQYGTDALGGVIQVLTKEPQFRNVNSSKKVSGIVAGKLMTAGMEHTGRAEVKYSGDRFAAAAGFTVRNFGNVLGGDTTGFQTPSGYRELAYDVKLKFLLKQNVELIAAQQLLRQSHVPVYHKVRLENFLLNEMDPQQRMLNYAKLRIKNANPFVQLIDVTVSHQQSIEGRNSQKNGSTVLRKEKDEVNTAGLTVDIRSAITKNWTASSGIDIYFDKVNSTRTDVNTVTQNKTMLRGLYPDAATYGNYSVFTLHQYQLKKVTVNAGLRFNQFDIHITDTSIGKTQIKPSALVANAGVVYAVTKQHHFFATFSNSYRAPNVDDMGTLGIVDFRYEVPAYNLLPERSHNYELGYKLRTAKLNVTVAAYYMQLQQLITRVRVPNETINGYNVYVKENTDEAFVKGLEIDADAELTKGLNIQAGIAYAYGHNSTRNEPLRRIPPTNGRVRTTYSLQHWFFAAESWFASKQNRLAQGDKDDNRIPKGGTTGFSIYNLYAGWQLKNIRVQASVQNLLNADYRTHGSGMNGYGRSAWLNIQFTL
ncbi:TonB-dependent receptor [Lacibacter luteus]|uniref:TonB-dependent receptor n=1 Tax=Lacibacter luteus TaxID=2508719 RepID=A0A4Q1CGS0_9BACT|nr:TonB-dependent receptor [Lacibacter luteus]RXK59355.1 TonB-dependent receptor [Lacibacter luteus]